MKISDITEGFGRHFMRGLARGVGLGNVVDQLDTAEEMRRKNKDRAELDRYSASLETPGGQAFTAMTSQLGSRSPVDATDTQPVIAKPGPTDMKKTGSARATMPKLSPGKVFVVDAPNGLKYYYNANADRWYEYHGSNWPSDYRVAQQVSNPKTMDYLTRAVISKNYKPELVDPKAAAAANKTQNRRKR